MRKGNSSSKDVKSAVASKASRKSTARLKKLSYCLSIDHCDPVLVFQKVYVGVYNGVTTSKLDELSTKTADAMTTNHPNYASVTRARNQSSWEFNFKRPVLTWEEGELQRLLDVIAWSNIINWWGLQSASPSSVDMLMH
ncbi:ribonucleoside-diphosphate reductase large subunit-like isoform X1 [Camellia sinensis]|uniref:ribonucleoside-diphosphate reductase large subunit-like isoform X1 n=1 Tax=Camellia sinensis TaxID=4442 RepID=UPI0010369850|nr:ribonucleoside-diphosphate reductase large subunit-like isoform X1 [Camellia sinensis]XP_028065603.1 ribonucleoside-diphosphate reductase large subunit-like isoform X1 [Camellia sinensis]XP_028065605.1 ribonucleoside-diphosphate reductase large subunit-like isoform X1 [Camellia sinensis]